MAKDENKTSTTTQKDGAPTGAPNLPLANPATPPEAGADKGASPATKPEDDAAKKPAKEEPVPAGKVKLLFPNPVSIVTKEGKLDFQAGVQIVDADLADHWYFKANGVSKV